MSVSELLLLIAVGALVAVVALRFFKAHASANKRVDHEASDRLVTEAKNEAAEHAVRPEAERRAAEDAARREAERKAAEDAARREADRLAVEEALLREEAELRAVEEAIEREKGRQAAEEARRPASAGEARLAARAVKTAEQTVVMVADDSRVVRVKTSRLLNAHRYQVVMAEDGLDAAQQIENSVPDVLVTDVDMPGIDGLELVRRVRCDPRTVHLPIILVTSDSEQLRASAAAAGVDVVLGKPYPEEQLIHHIQQLLLAQAGA